MTSPGPSPIAFELPTLVEASAGTGKTHAITSYFVRAILERDLTPDRILVVTYTKAATAELRSRTRQRVSDAMDAVVAGRALDDDLGPAIANALDRLGQDEVLDRLRRGRNEMDRAAIFTIHGLCQRLLQEHPLLFGIDFDFEIAEDTVSLFFDLAIDYWTTELHASPAWFVDALKARHISPEFLGRLATATLNGATALLGPAPAELDEAAVTHAHDRLRRAASLWWAHRSDITSILLDEEALNRQRYPKKSVRTKWFPDLDALFTRGSLELPEFFPKLTSRGMIVKRGHARPEHPFFDACEALVDAAEGVRDGVDYEVFRFQERFLEHVGAQSRARTREQALLTYDDLLSIVFHGLDEKAAAVIRQAYPVALVDEFQDTDSMQYGIFREIYGNESVVYVGDPKQAIYAFRGADVFSYLDAARDVGGRQRELTINRRSDPALVEAVNRLFSRRPAPFALEDIRFPRAVAYHEQRSTFEPAIEIVFVERDESGAESIEERVPSLIANEIGLLLESEERIDDRRVTPDDIAVLCRTNRQALLVTEALRELGIPTSLEGDSSVLGTEIAADLELALEAALMPGDASAVRRALLTPLVGITPQELHGMEDDEWSTWMTRFRAWHDQWHRDGVVRFLEELLRECGAETRIARKPTARRELTDLLHLEELLLRGERERHRDPVALMLWFRRLRQGSPEDTSVAHEDLQQRPDSDADTVRVTTIHKSKGLEYGVVYCPFLWGDAALFDFDRRVVKFHDTNDSLVAKCDLGSARLETHLKISEHEALSEALRLLYVGVTRAKHRCTLVWGAGRRWSHSALSYLLHGPSLQKELDEDRMIADLDALEAASGGTIGWRRPSTECATPQERQSGGRTLAAKQARRSFSQANRIASFTSLTGHHEKTAARAPEAARGIDPEASFTSLPGGARTGLLLHSLLERGPHAGLDDPSHVQRVENELRSYGYDPALAAPVLRDLHASATTPLLAEAPTLCLAAIPVERQLRELEFTLGAEFPDFGALARILEAHGAPHGAAAYPRQLIAEPPRNLGRFLRGFIDLLFEWEGRWYVADYKSNSLAKYDSQSIVEASAASHYLLQLLLYSVAAHRYLRQRIPGYDPSTQFGGAMLLFLRGMHGPEHPGSGVYFDPQSASLLTDVDHWLGGAR